MAVGLRMCLDGLDGLDGLCEHTHAYVQQLEQFITLMDEGQVGCSPAFFRGSV